MFEGARLRITMVSCVTPTDPLMDAAKYDNPYAPPRDEAPPPRSTDERIGAAASLGARAIAGTIDVVVDLLLFMGLAVAGELVVLALGLQDRSHAPVYFFAWFAVAAVQGTSLAHGGQSLGKRVTRTRIVLADGQAAGLLRGFVLRTVPPAILATVPAVLVWADAGEITTGACTILGYAALCVDALAILGARRCCLHDRMAGTFVVSAQRPEGAFSNAS